MRGASASAQEVGGPSLALIEELIEPWTRTREAFGPVWWSEFQRLSGTTLDRAQFNLLRRIARQPALSLTELANVAMMTTSTASRIIEVLVRQSLVERVVPSTDRRMTKISATEAGLELVELSEAIGAGLLAGPFSELRREDVEAFAATFAQLAPIVERWAQCPADWINDAAARRAEDGSVTPRPARQRVSRAPNA